MFDWLIFSISFVWKKIKPFTFIKRTWFRDNSCIYSFSLLEFASSRAFSAAMHQDNSNVVAIPLHSNSVFDLSLTWNSPPILAAKRNAASSQMLFPLSEPALAGGCDHRGWSDPHRRRDLSDHRRTDWRCARACVGVWNLLFNLRILGHCMCYNAHDLAGRTILVLLIGWWFAEPNFAVLDACKNTKPVTRVWIFRRAIDHNNGARLDLGN